VLTLSTREQHIRREKATSNICTNQGLIALALSIHLALRGPVGLRELGEHCLSNAQELERRLKQHGIAKLFSGPTLSEFAVRVPNAKQKLEAATSRGVVAGYLLERRYPNLKDSVLVACDELHTPADLDALVEVLK
jgi:glycine dehydrogenase subunit 1